MKEKKKYIKERKIELKKCSKSGVWIIWLSDFYINYIFSNNRKKFTSDLWFTGTEKEVSLECPAVKIYQIFHSNNENFQSILKVFNQIALDSQTERGQRVEKKINMWWKVINLYSQSVWQVCCSMYVTIKNKNILQKLNFSIGHLRLANRI